MANDKWNGSNPWLGLAPYTEGTPLYGRTKESVQLADIIKDYMASVVFGKSGIGKSSLLSAGISPLLREENYIPVRIRLVHNTEIPYTEQIESKVRETVDCIDRLPSDVNNLGLWDFFHRHSFTTENGIDCIPVIILDQFEEIYTLTDADHKKDIVAFFNELSSLLNDIKPDNVIEAEQKHSVIQNVSASDTPRRGLIKRSAASALNYTSATTFRFVICLREDKLYLLERNSANIPSLKANRYNLQALSPESALEVIMCPRPELFSNEEATAIVKKLVYTGDEGLRTVDPAILSLFLHENYEKKGTASFENIFADFYKNAINTISKSTIEYIEKNLMSSKGIRYQHPLDSILSQGIKETDVDSLIKKNILRKDTHNGITYIEFIHDLLAEVAANNIVFRKNNQYKKRNTFLFVVIFLISFFAPSFFYYRETIMEEQISNMWVVQLRTEASRFDYYDIHDSVFRKSPEVDSLLLYQNEVRELRELICSFGKFVQSKKKKDISACMDEINRYHLLSSKVNKILQMYLSLRMADHTRTGARVADDSKIREHFEKHEKFILYTNKTLSRIKESMYPADKKELEKECESAINDLWTSHEFRDYVDSLMEILKESIIYTNIMIDLNLDKNGL